jgi:hypothetical protein
MIIRAPYLAIRFITVKLPRFFLDYFEQSNSRPNGIFNVHFQACDDYEMKFIHFTGICQHGFQDFRRKESSLNLTI